MKKGDIIKYVGDDVDNKINYAQGTIYPGDYGIIEGWDRAGYRECEVGDAHWIRVKWQRFQNIYDSTSNAIDYHLIMADGRHFLACEIVEEEIITDEDIEI